MLPYTHTANSNASFLRVFCLPDIRIGNNLGRENEFTEKRLLYPFISGKVVGVFTIKTRLVLLGREEVRGNITAPLLSVDEGVFIIRILNIAKAEEPVENFTDQDHYSSDN